VFHFTLHFDRSRIPHTPQYFVSQATEFFLRNSPSNGAFGLENLRSSYSKLLQCLSNNHS
jgi:hypothetical protein